ncbi:MAG TPA: nucleotidyltransferase, partial [candidate division Zixibacteria bacterium]|nr:nucleotidyltransferase [candidate division Zixibacteria bacterium]
MYSNLTDADERELGLTPAEYNWGDFRQDVILALTQYYGAAFIDTSGTKAIKVLPKGGRLQADVVVCAKYIHYHERRLVAEGMTFWTSPGGTQIINYPKLHYENGTKKNNLQHTANWYKPSIRMFKNARNRILNDNPHLKDRFPSYFIECLLHNVLDSRYGTSYQN